MTSAEDLEARVDHLYCLPLERFVPERDALAKELRAEKRRDEAQRVSALAKPSVAAWAVNQIVRAQGAAARELWGAGDTVLAAQDRVVAGRGTGAQLREAVARERSALAPLVDAARGLVSGAGKFLTEPTLQAVGETLHAAAVDPGARPAVAQGRLARPLRLEGVSATGGGVTRAGAAGRRQPQAAPETEAQAAPAAHRARLAERDVADTADEARRREEEAARARRRHAQRQALVRARRDRDAARERVSAAVDDRDRARTRVEAAERALDEAEAVLGRADERLAAGHHELERAEDAYDAATHEAGTEDE
jgi:hypothetical protein